MDIRKIAMYLAGRLPPYYGTSNLRTFTKKLRNFAKEEFTNDEMLFIQQQAKNVEEEVYFMVLDDLRREATDVQEDGKKSKQDIINLFKDDLSIPGDVLGLNSKLVLTEYTDEADFTQNFLLSFFKQLGYHNVRYTHGQDEYGKDIIMKQVDKLGNSRYVGVQAKVGNIDGSAGGVVDTLISQAENGFKMSIKDLDTKQNGYISEFIIVTNGTIARNAKEKILGIEVHAIRNNITFIDRQKIESLLK